MAARTRGQTTTTPLQPMTTVPARSLAVETPMETKMWTRMIGRGRSLTMRPLTMAATVRRFSGVALTRLPPTFVALPSRTTQEILALTQVAWTQMHSTLTLTPRSLVSARRSFGDAPTRAPRTSILMQTPMMAAASSAGVSTRATRTTIPQPRTRMAGAPCRRQALNSSVLVDALGMRTRS